MTIVSSEVMIIAKKLLYIILFGILWTGCSDNGSKDVYLASLPKSAGMLAPADSLDLEQFGLVLPKRLVKFDRWLVCDQTQAKNNLAIINLDSHSKMEALRVGRGPGEMLQTYMAYLDGSKLALTEVNALTTVSLDLAALQEGYIPPFDTVGKFKSIKPATYRFCKVNGGYVSTNHYGGWYSLWDPDGFIGNTIDPPYVAGLEAASRSTLASFYGSSLLMAHPDGNRVCVALVGMAALSFSVIENRELKEIKRYEYNGPSVINDGGVAYISNEETLDCFHGIASDRDYVYLLYSGRMWPGEEKGAPSYECNHLLVYDWDGNFVTRYDLARRALSIFLDGNELYCLTQYPSDKLYIYRLPELS